MWRGTGVKGGVGLQGEGEGQNGGAWGELQGGGVEF